MPVFREKKVPKHNEKKNTKVDGLQNRVISCQDAGEVEYKARYRTVGSSATVDPLSLGAKEKNARMDQRSMRIASRISSDFESPSVIGHSWVPVRF